MYQPDRSPRISIECCMTKRGYQHFNLISLSFYRSWCDMALFTKSKYFVFVRKAVNSLKCLTYCSIKDYELRRRNPVKYLHSSHGEYIDTKAVSPRQENTTTLCWCTAKSRGTSPMACCQLSVSHIVLWLLISDRKSRPGQPCVRKYSRHCGCWQWRRRTEQSQVVQTCAKGQPGEQLNQKPDVAKRACSQLCNPPQSLTMVPRGAVKK